MTQISKFSKWFHRDYIEQIHGRDEIIRNLKNSLNFNSCGCEVDNYVTVMCTDCGIDFCLTTKWSNQVLDYNMIFFCPNGHPLAYKKKENNNNVIKLSSVKKKL